MTMTKISTVEVGAGGAASIDFTSIPGTYTDLLIKLSLRGTGADTSFFSTIFFNTSSANFTSRSLVGSGSAASSSSRTDALLYFVGANATASTFGNADIYIPNYAGSTNKSFSIDSVGENNATASRQEIWAGLWSQTAAITNFKITAGESTNFVTGSTVSLYGILKGSGGASVS
jgi:hypothetical protein